MTKLTSKDESTQVEKTGDIEAEKVVLPSVEATKDDASVTDDKESQNEKIKLPSPDQATVEMVEEDKVKQADKEDNPVIIPPVYLKKEVVITDDPIVEEVKAEDSSAEGARTKVEDTKAKEAQLKNAKADKADKADKAKTEDDKKFDDGDGKDDEKQASTQTQKVSLIKKTPPVEKNTAQQDLETPKAYRVIIHKIIKNRCVRFFVKLLMVLFAVLLILTIYFDSKVDDHFSGQLLEHPTRVFSRILTLKNGETVTLDALKWELERLGYSLVEKPQFAGEYRVLKNSVELIRRPFYFDDGYEASVHALVSFNSNGVTRVQNAKSKENLAQLRIEPQLLGMLGRDAERQHFYLSRENYPEFLKQALIATEDRDFYNHNGISPVAIMRAFSSNVKAGRITQGGSTLTQQLTKNIFLSRERSLLRKAHEVMLSVLIDFRYGKDEILEAYLNEVYIGQALGQAVHGFALGAELYFDLPIQELRPDQLALLVGIVKGPSYYNPWRYPERTKERRDLILRIMMEEGYLTSESYTAAISQELDVQKVASLNNSQPAYFDALRKELVQRVGRQRANEAGLRIFSTLDPLSQSLLEKTVRTQLPNMKRRAGNELEVAAVALNMQGLTVP